jgi:hypothetical protein
MLWIFEAREEAPLAADLLLAAIQKLYRIERGAKEEKLPLEKRLELRQREARPLFEDLGGLLDAYSKELLPKSPLGKAVNCQLRQEPVAGHGAVSGSSRSGA